MDEDIGLTRVAGVSFYQEELERCAAGEPVRFVHEPDNPHDETAICVMTIRGAPIGYLPRKSSLHRAVHEFGRGLSGVIASIGYSRSCLLGVTLSVAMSDDLPAIRSYHRDRPAPTPPNGGFRYWIKTPADVARLLAERK